MRYLKNCVYIIFFSILFTDIMSHIPKHYVYAEDISEVAAGAEATAAEDESIVIKSVLVNPSKTQSQKIPFKQNLPREITPESILDLEDLNIDFDYQKGQYFVHKEYDLKPGETKTVKITVKDVWKIPQDEIAAIRNRSEDMLKNMEGTEDYERAKRFKEGVDTSLNKMERKMGGGALSPAEQMIQYRELLEMLNSLKADITAAESSEENMERFKPEAAWNIIITIVASLGVLSSIFFYLWYTKINSQDTTMSNKNIVTSLRPAVPPPIPEPEKKESKQEKKVDASNIEEMLKKKKAS